MASCRVFWGSHGCGLERGHQEPDRHLCWDPEDGLCSAIEWAQDERTGIWVWDWRFSGDGRTVGGTAFPTGAYGEDVPADRVVKAEDAALVHATRQSAGELAVMRDGKWVRAGDGTPWNG